MRITNNLLTVSNRAARLIMGDNMNNTQAIEQACSEGDEFLDNELFTLLERLVFDALVRFEA